MISNTPKMVHEALCAATSALGQTTSSLRHGQIEQLQVLINKIEEHRPIGVAGKHRDLHTDTCGCDGHRRPWSITLDVEP